MMIQLAFRHDAIVQMICKAKNPLMIGECVETLKEMEDASPCRYLRGQSQYLIAFLVDIQELQFEVV